MSRNHHIIPVEDYQRTTEFNVNFKCRDHCEQLDFYCPKHEIVVCALCVQLKHCSCKDVKPLDAREKVSKTCTALSDLEQTIDGPLENIENGDTQITSKECAVYTYVERRPLQEQYQRPAEQPVHKLDNIQLKLINNIKMGEKNSEVTSCLILPNKYIMIASWNTSSITILNEDGSYDRDISVPYNPYDVTIIDDQRVAVSYGETFISIININTRNTNKTLENLCKNSILGIKFNDGKLYAVAWGEGIKIIDLDGNIIKTIRIYKDAWDTWKVTSQKDKIYYSVNNGSVYCVDMEGKEIWTCQGNRLLYNPAIDVDNYGITFAAGRENNLLLAISPDGKQQKVLLTISDGLQKPNAVYYDKDSKRLLVCNRTNGHAALYDIIY